MLVYTHTTSATRNMSSPLLDKLAPDLRQRIYEYVLAFDAPLRHIARMRPFADKIINYNGIPWSQFALLGSDSTTASMNGDKPLASSSPVNKSLLVADKLIYTEAIAVFYDTNTIRFESQLSWLHSIIPPHLTDLSLATHVICKIDMPQQEEGAYEMRSPLCRKAYQSSSLSYAVARSISSRIALAILPSPSAPRKGSSATSNRSLLASLTAWARWSPNPITLESSF